MHTITRPLRGLVKCALFSQYGTPFHTLPITEAIPNTLQQIYYTFTDLSRIKANVQFNYETAM